MKELTENQLSLNNNLFFYENELFSGLILRHLGDTTSSLLRNRFEKVGCVKY